MFGPLNQDFNGKRKINLSDKKEVEPQEIFLDYLAQKKIERDGFSSGKIEVPLSRRCFYGLFFFSLFLFSVLLFRSFQLQVIRGEEFMEKAQRNRFAYSFIQSSRGVIYDKDLNQLVYNRPVFNLVANKKEISEDKESIFQKLSEIIDVGYGDLIDKYNESNEDEFIILADLDHESLVSLEVKTRNLNGVGIRNETIRYYEDGKEFSHLIGYLGKISPEEVEGIRGYYPISGWSGKSGLEKYYEETLRIIPGRVRTERDVLGNPLSEELISPPQSGNSLVLTVDSNLQKEIYSILEENLKNIGSKNAAVVAMDPQTGEILSLVSFPGFDNNIFSTSNNVEINSLFNDPEKPLFNRVIGGSYPVGSSIKPFIAAAALEEKIVTPEKQFFSSGSITIPNPWNPSQPTVFSDWMAHGWVNLRRALAVSSNVYFYTVGGGFEDQKGLGANLMKKYLNIFGWGSKTNIDLPEEKDGFIPSPEWKEETKKEPWRVGDSYNLSIGQGDISVTPLQVAYAYNAIANDGKLIKPMIVKKIIDEKGDIVEVKEPEIVEENIIPSSTLKVVREGMRDAVNYGSATTLQSLPVTSAAKTGTAQISKAGYYHNWVSVFAPYDNPEIVLTVIIEEVEGMRAAVLPVARDILNFYFTEK